jgi:hypothetical protein
VGHASAPKDINRSEQTGRCRWWRRSVLGTPNPCPTERSWSITSKISTRQSTTNAINLERSRRIWTPERECRYGDAEEAAEQSFRGLTALRAVWCRFYTNSVVIILYMAISVFVAYVSSVSCEGLSSGSGFPSTGGSACKAITPLVKLHQVNRASID